MTSKQTTTSLAPQPDRTPFSLLRQMTAELDRVFDWPAFRWPAFDDRAPMLGAAWSPRIDVFEKNNRLITRVDLPGMKKEDVHVAIEEGDLILKGERKEEKEVKEEDFYKAECFYGSFYRRLPLNFEVAPDKVSAKFTDGVLEVRLPMPPGEQKPAPQEIAIN